MWMRALILWGGCSSTGGPSLDEGADAAVDEVFSQLRAALEQASNDEVDASLERCDQGLVQFEDQVEPALREACGQLCTTAIEYDLGRFRAQLSVSAEGAGAILDDLDKRVSFILELPK